MFSKVTTELPCVANALALRAFALKMMQRLVPGARLEAIGADSVRAFERKIAGSLESLGDGASSIERQRTVAAVVINDIETYFGTLRNICRMVGLEKIGNEYLDVMAFVKLATDADGGKIARLMAIADGDEKDLGKVFFAIAGVLTDSRVSYEGLDDEAKRKAGEDAGSVAGKLCECAGGDGAKAGENCEIAGISDESSVTTYRSWMREKVDFICAKVSNLRPSGKSCGRYEENVKDLCWLFWTTGPRREGLVFGENTRLTYRAVFNYFKVQLARIGVMTLEAFAKIVSAVRHQRNRLIREGRLDVAMSA